MTSGKTKKQMIYNINYLLFTIEITRRSEFDFHAAVENSAFGMCINFLKNRILMRRRDDRSETALARVGEIFGVGEKTEFTDGFFKK